MKKEIARLKKNWGNKSGSTERGWQRGRKGITNGENSIDSKKEKTKENLVAAFLIKAESKQIVGV